MKINAVAIILIVGLSVLPRGHLGAAENDPASKTPIVAPTPLSPADRKLYEDANNLVQTYGGCGNNLEKAFPVLMDLARRNPQSAYPVAGLAELKYLLSNYGDGSAQEAFVLAQRAIQLDPKSADGYVVVAKIMIDQKNMVAGQQAADKAIALAPEKPEAMFAKARAAEAGRRYEESEQWFRKAIDRHTDRQRKANIYFWLGEMFTNKKPRDLPGAIAAYEKSSELASDQAICLLNGIASFYLKYTDHYDQAIACLSRALNAEDFQGGQDNLGHAMFAKWGDAYIHPEKYRNSKQKPDSPKAITAKTGVTPEYVFSMNPMGFATPWATIAMLKNGMIKDVDVVAPRANGTALTSAAYGNHLDVVKMLVARHANVNAADNDNKSTAIFYAVSNGNLEMVRFLVEHGARLNLVDGTRRPLVARAMDKATREDVRILSYLLEKGADPSLPDQNGDSLIAGAVFNGNASAVRLLLQKYKADPNASLTGMPVLAIAAVSSGSSTETVKALLEGKANPWIKYGPNDVLFALAKPQVNEKMFPSFKDNFEMILEARKSMPKPADFGKAYGEK